MGLQMNGSATMAAEMLYQIHPDFEEAFTSPSTLVDELWRRGELLLGANNNLRGEFFELLVALALYKWDVRPFYYQAKLALIPETDYDFALWTQQGPVVLSVKTSLRERVKQAALEAVALRMVHRRAECYVLTLNQDEATNAQRKVERGDLPALSAVITASTADFDVLIQRLATSQLMAAPTVPLIAHSRSVVA